MPLIVFKPPKSLYLLISSVPVGPSNESRPSPRPTWCHKGITTRTEGLLVSAPAQLIDSMKILYLEYVWLPGRLSHHKLGEAGAQPVPRLEAGLGDLARRES